MSILGDLFDAIQKSGDSGFQTLFETTTGKDVLVQHSGGASEITSYANEVFERNHSFLSLEGLLSYLNSKHCEKDNGVIFVNSSSVLAELRYGQSANDQHQATMRLVVTKEYRALERLSQGIDQMGLWRLLETDLYGCVDNSLASTIRTLALSSKDMSEVRISDSGITSKGGSSVIKLDYPSGKGEGSRTATLPLDWEFEIQMWDCFDKKKKIQTRIEVDLDHGLHFIFHPRQVETSARQARLELVEAIKSGLAPDGDESLGEARFTVHEGELNS